MKSEVDWVLAEIKADVVMLVSFRVVDTREVRDNVAEDSIREGIEQGMMEILEEQDLENVIIETQECKVTMRDLDE